ncbi:hypothetical protein ACQPX6_07540 [Actinomycetospora sp. CA-101289]|uniref:hypothetical protein n=1 Tax=Actinomycetospora sp. CA-101289 TaxID=3239893 RepID=UPI003D99FA8E
MASNAWERAQEAIAHAHQRAAERDEDVVTPDNAVSPFDASSTAVLPAAMTSGRHGGDPDLTQRLPQNDGGRRPGNGQGPHRNGNGQGGRHGRPPEDPATVRLGAQQGPSHPGTSPFPANPFPGGGNPRPAEDGRADDHEDDEPPRRSWWRRLFGR